MAANPESSPKSASYGSYSGFPIVKIVVNGQEIRGDVPGVIVSGRTMVPVRFVSEALGADVTWDQATLKVGITSKESVAGSVNHVILSAIHVTADWNLFTEMHGGWPAAIPNKDTLGVKFYEAAIWDDGLSIHFYAFPNDFDASYGSMENLPMQERVAYRESFCVMKIPGMPAEQSERGQFVLDAFTKFAKLLVERHPDASHNLT